MPSFGLPERQFASPLNPLVYVRAHPYISGSVVLHVVVLAALLALDFFGAFGTRTAAPPPRSVAAIRAEQDDLARRVQVLERIRETLKPGVIDRERANGAPPDSGAMPKDANPQYAKSLRQEARRIAEEIQAIAQEARAKDLAKLLQIPEAKALERAKAETPPIEKQSLDQLQQRAHEAMAAQQRRLDKEREGTRLANASPRDRSTSGQANAGSRTGVRGDGDTTRSGGASSGAGLRELALDTGLDPRNYRAMVEPSPIDAAQFKPGAGRIIGAKGTYANRFYIDSWYLIGPFDGHGTSSVHDVYPPEQLVDLDAVYPVDGTRTLRWKYTQFPSYPLIPPNAAETAVYFGYTEINMSEARDVWVSMGADDDAKVWVNGDVIWTSGTNDKPWYHKHFKTYSKYMAELNLSETTRRVHLKKGRNKVLFKLYNGASATFFSFVISL